MLASNLKLCLASSLVSFERPSEFWMAPEHLATQHAHSLKDAKELAVHVSKSRHVPRQAAAELGMLLGRELVELRDVLVRAAQILMDHSLQLGHLSDVAERYRLGRERIERVHACATGRGVPSFALGPTWRRLCVGVNVNM